MYIAFQYNIILSFNGFDSVFISFSRRLPNEENRKVLRKIQILDLPHESGTNSCYTEKRLYEYIVIGFV